MCDDSTGTNGGAGSSSLRNWVPAFVISSCARFLYNENYFICPMDHRVEESSEETKLEYRWRQNGHWNRLAIVAREKPQVIRTGSLEEFITHHEWGYTRQRDGSSIEYRVDHPCWEVAPASETILECDGGSLYGERFGPPLSKPPSSAFVVPGSAVTVYRGKALPAL